MFRDLEDAKLTNMLLRFIGLVRPHCPTRVMPIPPPDSYECGIIDHDSASTRISSCRPSCFKPNWWDAIGRGNLSHKLLDVEVTPFGHASKARDPWKTGINFCHMIND